MSATIESLKFGDCEVTFRNCVHRTIREQWEELQDHMEIYFINIEKQKLHSEKAAKKKIKEMD